MFRLFLSTIFVVATVFGSSTSALAAPAYKLQQTSQIVGEFDVAISDKGVIARSRKGAVSLVCMAPYKDVVLFSERTRKYFSYRYIDFRCTVNKTLTALNAGLLSETPMTAAGTTTYKNNKCKVYKSTGEFKAKQLSRYRNKEIPGRGPQDLTCYTADNIKIDNRISNVICRFYGLPIMPDYPLSAEFYDLGGDKNISLSTEKLAQTNVDDSLFKMPGGFTKALKNEELWVSNETAAEVQMMMGAP